MELRISRRVLVVDDSESIREAVVYGLENEGYEVDKAQDGKDALLKLDGRRVDLVLTDFHMPRMNGLELIEEIRKMNEYKRVPIVVFTTETQQDIIRQVKKAGATGWLVKPFPIDKLITTIRRLVR